MLLVSTDFITDKKLQTLGIVYGIGKGFLIKKQISSTNEEMKEEARALGGDAIINVRYQYTEDACIFGFGTAVRFM